MDMTQVTQPKSDQINADDLIAGPMTVTIDEISIDPRNEQPVTIRVAGMKKVYRPCKSMRRVMIQIWGADASKYAGRSMTLYRDPSVTWGGVEVGGIRISHMTGIDSEVTMALTKTQKQRTAYKVRPLQMQQQSAPPIEPANALDICEAVARRGTEALRAWWNSDEYKTVRDTAQANKAHLGAMAALADSANQPADPPPAEEEGPPM